jgi:hypothetical protein
VLIQIGGFEMTLFGHWRSDNCTGGKARYFAAGFCNIMGCSWVFKFWEVLDAVIRRIGVPALHVAKGCRAATEY